MSNYLDKIFINNNFTFTEFDKKNIETEIDYNYNIKKNENGEILFNIDKFNIINNTESKQIRLTSKEVETLNTQPGEDELYYYDDYWADTFSNNLGSTNGSLYFYYQNSDIIKNLMNTDRNNRLRNMLIIPPVDAISSVNYHPYLNGDDVLIKAMKFDLIRMPIDKSENSFSINPYVFRIQNLLNQNKKVGSFNRYKAKKNSNLRDYNNESKIQSFPFSYGMLYDGVADPIEVIFENFNDNKNIVDVYVNQPISNMGTYAISLKGYKGDTKGNIEGGLSNKSFNLPIVNNAYMNFMSQNQAGYRTQMTTSVIKGITGAVAGGAAGFAMAGPAGAAIGAGSALASSGSAIAGQLAQKKDLTTTPNSLKNAGSDILFYKNFNNGYLNFYRYEIREEYKKLIGDYFAMYGYKQNKLSKINPRNRYYYNYIKTYNANLISNTIPREHLLEIKNIYNNGITLWHIDREGVKFGEYKYDNKETYNKIP